MTTKCHILIISKDAEIARMLQMFLTGQGHQAIVTHQVDDFMALCVEQKPNVLILDARHTTKDEHTITNELRFDKHTADLHFLLLSDKMVSYDFFGIDVPDSHIFALPFNIARLGEYVERGC